MSLQTLKVANKQPLHPTIPLFFSLCFFFLIPFLYQCVRTRLVVNIPSVDGLGIAGHIEWFDLINETLQAFLLVPLYHLLGEERRELGRLKGRMRSSFVISTVIYIIFSIAILIGCSSITSFMTGAADLDVTSYLCWETVAFTVGHFSSFAVIVFVMIGKPSYIVVLTIGKAIATVLADIILIPNFGVNGVAYSNIAVNGIAAIICLVLVEGKELRSIQPIYEKGWGKDWVRIGSFSGGQIFLNNLIYALIVCKMVNSVTEQGNYWVANNFIWGFMLVPVAALSEIIKRENSPKNASKYCKASAGIILAWIISIPLWEGVLKGCMGIAEPKEIMHILMTLLPFYFAYAFCAVFENIFTAAGKTVYNFILSIIVNLGYYGIMYSFFLRGKFHPSIDFVCYLFGFGMLVNIIGSAIIFATWRKRLRQKGEKV